MCSIKACVCIKLMLGFNIILAALAMTSYIRSGQSLNLTFQKFASSRGSSKWPTVLFIHGLDSSKHTWRDINRRLQDDGFNSVSIDLRGWGSSPLGKSRCTQMLIFEFLAHTPIPPGTL